MAEALVSALLEELASFVAQQLQEELSLTSGIEGKVDKLASNFKAIQAVLIDAEKRQIKEASVRDWLDKLKAVSFEMDAVLDEWSTAIVLRSNLNRFEKVCLFAQSPCFHNSSQVHRVGLRHRMALKLEQLNDKLDGISLEKERYTFITQRLPETSRAIEHQSPKTTSLVDASEVYGRDIEKNILINKLLSESSQAAQGGHDVIAIVGMGGIGKTTLAQLAFNDKKVNAHFDLKIWVCVSDPFDEFAIARAIVVTLKPVEFLNKLVKFEELLNCIHESITGRRFLLVLDDVWTEDDRKWKQIENSLKSGGPGSKILVTTRNENVAIMMWAENCMIRLDSLSKELCWSIFSQIAFLGKEKSEQLEEIGRQIARKSEGLPLVAKTLGSLMRFKKYNKEQWEEVLHDELWNIKVVKEKVFLPLLLSYYDLPPLEKRCFLYCSYFPKDRTLNRDELIQLWASQGFLNVRKDYERKGVNCYENLASRSLFQEFKKDEQENIISCKMHDIVHDFVMFLTKNEWLNIVISPKKEKMEALDDNEAFHCTVVVEPKAQIPTLVYGKKSLRTLSIRNLDSFRSDIIRWDLLLKLTSLRTLTLDNCHIARVPMNIDNLIHLRYLSFGAPNSQYIIKFPKSLYNLINLHTLKVDRCETELPEGIEKLVNLRHLCLGYYNKVPKGLGKLTCLETLTRLEIDTPQNRGRFQNQAMMTLGDLESLNRLKGSLSIIRIGEIKKDVDEAYRAQLKEKERLVALNLHFGGFGDKETLLLEGLQPHPNLKQLTIRYYSGATVFPGWMASLINLKSLQLSVCHFVECLGPFGKLPCLESLTLRDMINVKRVGVEFLGMLEEAETTKPIANMENCSSSTISFPKLKQLMFIGLENWEEWEWCRDLDISGMGNEDHRRRSTIIIMPRLVSLTIGHCPSLKAPLPEFLRRTPLQKLEIRRCPQLERHCKEGMGTEEKVKILTSPTYAFAENSAEEQEEQHSDVE